MVVMVLCECDGLPAHDHFMGFGVVDGFYQGIYDADDIGRVGVPWKDVARELCREAVDV